MLFNEYVIQWLVIAIIIGVVYSLWKTTQSFGGLIGSSLRWIGIGILFVTLEALDRVLGDLSYVQSVFGANAELAHSLILVVSLACSGIGFSKLRKITK